ncbi:bifunctional oligoribonuclease/PAP phosphatase NrnA [Nakamurella silvestris]|nr:bifunctional oligoribonuclease/PAP phosphatase NrnA [Nakamurella silvestris]
MTELGGRTNKRRTDLAAVLKALVKARTVVILAHVNPDADALGSALALGLALESSGREVVVSFSYPSEVPASLRALPGQHLIRPVELVPTTPDLVVSVDVGSVERLGALGSLFRTAGDSVCIDHHASNTGFGNHQLIDTGANATVCLIAEILNDLDQDLTKAIATNLYAGLATDTGGFRFAASQDHVLAAELLEHRIDPEEIIRPIMDSHPFGWLGMLSSVLGDAVLDRSAVGGAGLVAVTISLAAAEGMRQEELDSVIDIIRTADEAEVAAVIKETDPGRWQVSLRAKNFANVAAVAATLGGGGHPRAAGYGTSGQAHDVLSELTAALGGSAVRS